MSLFRTVVKILLVVSLLAVLVQSGIVGNVIDSIFTDGTGRYTPEKPAVTTPDEQLPEKYYVRSYSWTYGGEEWSYSVSVPETTYKRCQNLDHRSRNWEQYTNDKSGRLYLSGLADLFVRDGKAAGHDDYDIVMNAVAFVQSLPYTSDDVTSGHDEYPRYPLETLVDNGGDCEDTAIFMAALLRLLSILANNLLAQFTINLPMMYIIMAPRIFPPKLMPPSISLLMTSLICSLVIAKSIILKLKS